MIAIRRFHAASRGRVGIDDFRDGESGNVPLDVTLPNRLFMNLVEVPVLFYVLCLVLLVTAHVTTVSLWLAWAYVVLRIVHSLIYLTYNRVFHRFMVFGASNLAVLGLLIDLALKLPN